jgi:hypothetical protein
MIKTCPKCDGAIELYDVAKDGDSGRYRCLDCGADSVWHRVKTGFFMGRADCKSGD